jgi:hypothetical protein
MKALLLSLFAGVTMAAAAGVRGNGLVHTAFSGNESDLICTFTQKEDALTGTCAGDRGKFEVSGKVNGSKVSWSYKSEYNGTPLTVKHDGAVDGTAGIKGNVEVPEFGVSGEFTATPSK